MLGLAIRFSVHRLTIKQSRFKTIAHLYLNEPLNHLPERGNTLYTWRWMDDQPEPALTCTVANPLENL